MSYQEEKDRGKRAKRRGKKIKKEKEKRKAELGIHWIKADHGITEGKEPLITLPQIFPVGLAEAFIQPLDRKVKMKGKKPIIVRDIHKSTLRSAPGLILKNSSSRPACLASALRPSPGIESSHLMLTASFYFHSEPSLVNCLLLFTQGADSKGSIKVTRSSLAI